MICEYVKALRTEACYREDARPLEREGVNPDSIFNDVDEDVSQFFAIIHSM